MATLPRAARDSSSPRLTVRRGHSRLTADEREVIITYNDAEKVWRVYSDSATMRGAVLRLARQLGAEVLRLGDHGLEFEAPAAAVRLTARRRARSSEASLANLRRSPRGLDSIGAPEGKLAILDGTLGGDS